MTRVAWAEWKPLSAVDDEPPVTPTVLIFHTMVGFLRGTDAVFRQNGYLGTESTFGLGGPWDGGTLDGALWQWQDTHRQADAQFAGNAYANSVETSDGGHPTAPWSSKQIETLVKLTVDWCRQTGNPCVFVSAPHERGLGWHEQFWEWNHGDHACPGPIREGQLRTIVIPKARAALEGGTFTPGPTEPSRPDGKIAEDGILGPETVAALQRRLEVDADGIMGPNTRVALQRFLGVRPDSILGPQSVKALQKHVHAVQTAFWDRLTTRALQRALNSGTF
jgi:hypothetical protein